MDAHLAAIADEVTEFRQAARRRTDTLAASAAEQVRVIVEAAESSAAEIQRQAENDAREIRNEANREAEATREEAVHQAREYVGSVSDSTGAMLSRLEAMESELSGLIESLRIGAHRINADLNVLEGNLAEVRDIVRPRPEFEPEDEPAAEPGAEERGSIEQEVGQPAGAEPGAGRAAWAEHPVPEPAGGGYEHAVEPAAPAPAPAPEPEQVPGGGGYEGSKTHAAASEPDEGSDDAEGARLIALNMALNGTPRHETERYLTENFHLADPASLLDEIYTSVQG